MEAVALDADVIVVGGGVMGAATAWWLARRGHEVVVLDRFDRGHRRGSSHGGSRIFRLAYPDPFYVDLARRALPLWRELEDDAGCPLLETTGGVDHGPPEVVHGLAAALDATGVRAEVLSPGAAAERWPGMRFDRAVLHQADAGRCRAESTVAACLDGAAAAGAALHLGTGPAELAPAATGDGVVVRTRERSWRARVAVVTTGAWVGHVLAGHVELPPHTVTLEQVQHFAPVDPAASWPSFLHHRVDGPVVYGLETPGEGVKVDEHHAGRLVDPDDPDRSADETRRRALTAYVEAWFPGLDPTPVHPAACLYTTTPTEDFIVDRVGALVLGSPCSGHGFKFAPLIGRMLADLADGTAPEANPRFALSR